MRNIDEKTKISLSFVLSLLAMAFSVGIAFAKVSQIATMEQVIRNIDQRLSRIEGRLGIKE